MMVEPNFALSPLGTSSFGTMRMRGQIYVDKTALIGEIAMLPQKFLFIRPRRFGKSLLISTFACLFRNGLEAFRGLAIEKLWKEDQRYRVIRLDFSCVKSFCDIADFSRKLTEHIAMAFRSAGFSYDWHSPVSLCGQLDEWIESVPRNSLVILIDEYDAPLTACRDQPELLKAVGDALADFYNRLNFGDGAIRFLFITGITKLQETDVFFNLHNLIDLTRDPRYGSLLGFTSDEITAYFADYVDYAAQLLGLSQEALMKSLVKYYGGYCFDREAKARVLAPWSILKFLARPENGFWYYWVESGGSISKLRKYLRSSEFKDPKEYGREKAFALRRLRDCTDDARLSDIRFLLQTGYLTIVKVSEETVYADYPNLEVRTAMAQLYTEQLIRGQTAGQIGADNIQLRLASESAESVLQVFDRLVQAIDYQKYPINDEAALQVFLQVYLDGAGLDPQVEVHNSKGRSDLGVRVASRRWIFELKVARADQSEEGLLAEAVAQLEKYGQQYEPCEVIRVAMVFSTKHKCFNHWKVVF